VFAGSSVAQDCMGAKGMSETFESWKEKQVATGNIIQLRVKEAWQDGFRVGYEQGALFGLQMAVEHTDEAGFELEDE
jgi:hypothetical protein